MKILIVDDEVETLESIKNILKPTYYEIKTTINPSEALKLFKNENFDVVVLDLKMQPIDGLTLLRFLREENQETYVIIISAYEESSVLEAADKFNIHAIFKKPLDTKKFINELKEINILRNYEIGNY